MYDPIVVTIDHYQFEDEKALAERLADEPGVESEGDGWVLLEEREDGITAPLRVAGDSVTLITRELMDPLSMVRDMPMEAPGPVGGEFDADELTEIMEKTYRRIYGDWADVPVPALDNRTPREAVKTEEGRQAVIDLLSSYDRNEKQQAHRDGREVLNFNFLRREIGLPEI